MCLPSRRTKVTGALKTSKYPDNNPKSQYGVKKPRLSTIPATALLHVAQAMQTGNEKYGPYNWRGNKVSATVYVDAALRHLLTWYNGEDLDEESGANHLAHAIACMCIVLDAHDVGNLVDDRPPKAPVGKLIRKYAETGKL